MGCGASTAVQASHPNQNGNEMPIIAVPIKEQSTNVQPSSNPTSPKAKPKLSLSSSMQSLGRTASLRRGNSGQYLPNTFSAFKSTKNYRSFSAKQSATVNVQQHDDGSKTTTVMVPVVPANVEDFVKLRNNIAQTPFGGAAIVILALYIVTQSEDMGFKCLTAALDASLLTHKFCDDDDIAFEMSFLREIVISAQLMADIKAILTEKKYIPASYFSGTSPDMNYQVAHPFTITLHQGAEEPDSELITLQVTSTGDTNKRFVTLTTTEQGLWKGKEILDLLKDVSPPE